MRLLHTLLKTIHKALLFQDGSYKLFTQPSRQIIFNIICPCFLISFLANVTGADACSDEHKSMNILCHS